MSATRDKSQKIAFVYSNLYNIYRKGREAAMNADISPATAPESTPDAMATPLGLTTSQVLKAASAPKITEFRPVQLIGRRLPNPFMQAVPAPASPSEQTEMRAKAVLDQPVSLTGYEPILGKEAEALTSLRKNLDQLNQLHSRLHFMLQELEDLVKE